MSNYINIWLSNWTSEHTRKAYESDLKEFATFLNANNIELEQLDNVDLTIKFRDTLQSQDKSPGTIARKMASIKSFASWMVAEGHWERNPVASLKAPKPVVLEPTLAFTDEEVRKLLTLPNRDSFYGNMHYMVLVILFNMGLRRSEIVAIRLKDIYEDRGFTILKIIGKGQKERLVPVNKTISDALSIYKSTYTLFSGVELNPDDYLLQSQASYKNPKPMDSGTINRIVKQYSKEAGIERRLSAHSCRATAISHLLEKSVPIGTVAHMAGHSSINTTTSYDKRRTNFENSAVFKIEY